jgi:hypothetical protein
VRTSLRRPLGDPSPEPASAVGERLESQRASGRAVVAAELAELFRVAEDRTKIRTLDEVGDWKVLWKTIIGRPPTTGLAS